MVKIALTNCVSELFIKLFVLNSNDFGNCAA